jgi:hypothetical protein
VKMALSRVDSIPLRMCLRYSAVRTYAVISCVKGNGGATLRHM